MSKLKNVRKFVSAAVGAVLTIGFSLGLSGTAQSVLIAIATLASAAGVYGLRNGDKPADPTTVTVQGGGSAELGPMGG